MKAWPFTGRNLALRALELDRMSEIKGSHMNANSVDILHVTLEDNRFVLRKNGMFVTSYRTATATKRYLRSYYRELILKTSIWSE